MKLITWIKALVIFKSKPNKYHHNMNISRIKTENFLCYQQIKQIQMEKDRKRNWNAGEGGVIWWWWVAGKSSWERKRNLLLMGIHNSYCKSSKKRVWEIVVRIILVRKVIQMISLNLLNRIQTMNQIRQCHSIIKILTMMLLKKETKINLLLPLLQLHHKFYQIWDKISNTTIIMMNSRIHNLIN